MTFLRETPGGTDEMGLPTPGTIVETPVEGCAIWPRTSSEQEQARSQVIVGLTVFIPPGVDVPAADRARVRGVVYEVDGEPGFYRSPLTGHASGTEVALKRVTG
ncbi:hypothetical protein [Nocardiopsis alba]